MWALIWNVKHFKNVQFSMFFNVLFSLQRNLIPHFVGFQSACYSKEIRLIWVKFSSRRKFPNLQVFEKIVEGLVIYFSYFPRGSSPIWRFSKKSWKVWWYFFHSFPGGSPFCRFQTKFTENCLQSGEVPQIAKIPQTVVKIYMELPRLESTRTPLNLHPWWSKLSKDFKVGCLT